MAVGAAVPPEQVLCESFGVSRSVIRESLKLLEEKGLVVIRQGHGTTVLGPDRWDLLDPLVLRSVIEGDTTLAIFDDVIEVRCALETQLARHAATRLTTDQLEELQALVLRLESLMDDVGAYTRVDLEYHDAITRFAGNQLARSVLRSVQGFGMTHHTTAEPTEAGPTTSFPIEATWRFTNSSAAATPRGRPGPWRSTSSCLGRGTKSGWLLREAVPTKHRPSKTRDMAEGQKMGDNGKGFPSWQRRSSGPLMEAAAWTRRRCRPGCPAGRHGRWDLGGLLGPGTELRCVQQRHAVFLRA